MDLVWIKYQSLHSFQLLVWRSYFISVLFCSFSLLQGDLVSERAVMPFFLSLFLFKGQAGAVFLPVTSHCEGDQFSAWAVYFSRSQAKCALMGCPLCCVASSIYPVSSHSHAGGQSKQDLGFSQFVWTNWGDLGPTATLAETSAKCLWAKLTQQTHTHLGPPACFLSAVTNHLPNARHLLYFSLSLLN